MRPIKLHQSSELVEPLLDGEVLVALTPEDIAIVMGGLDAFKLLVQRDLLLRKASGSYRPVVNEARLAEVDQLETDFRSL